MFGVVRGDIDTRVDAVDDRRVRRTYVGVESAQRINDEVSNRFAA
jgi:hypothetical protein